MGDTIIVETPVATVLEVSGLQGPQGPAGASQADVLTTQGDLLYRGASAAARLAIGTAGQVLKVNSGATAPEWAAETIAVPTSRTISAGTGLTGGGDLSANRTLAVSYGTTAGTACQGNDGRIAGIESGSIAISASTIIANATGFQFIGGDPSLGTIDTSDDGGAILTYSNGGKIDTSQNGGAISTRGTGSIEFGSYGTRTTLTGTATADRAISLPNAAGTLALTSDITKSAVGLGNVTNNAQTQAAIVPNTAPSAGQLLVGNAGGTAYAPASVSGDATLSSTGVLTLANTTTARTNLGITQLPAKVEVFTSSGTWTKPAGAKMVHYVLVGGGGGGGGGRRSNSTTAAYGGGGGAGGGVSVGWLNADFLGATETVTIGAGGSGGSARTAADTNGADGVAGNTTSFTAYLEARGGAQGSGGTTTTGTRGAATAARGAFYGGTQDAMAGGGAGSPETTGGTGENRMSMPSGGGGGAGKSAAGAYGTGGASAAIGLSGTGVRTGISATANAAGSNGTGFFYYGLGGSGGSPNSTTGAANKGGDGGLYGAGGGGGAGSLNAAGGDNSGGAGANGVAVITTYF